MRLFDSDALPATAQVQLVGDRSSAFAYVLRDFLTRNGLPFDGTRAHTTAQLNSGVHSSGIEMLLWLAGHGRFRGEGTRQLRN
jgi:hypothetical protein